MIKKHQKSRGRKPHRYQMEYHVRVWFEEKNEKYDDLVVKYCPPRTMGLRTHEYIHRTCVDKRLTKRTHVGAFIGETIGNVIQDYEDAIKNYQSGDKRRTKVDDPYTYYDGTLNFLE